MSAWVAGFGRRLSYRPEVRVLGLAVVVAIVFAILEPRVFTSYEVTLKQVATHGFVALGATVALIAGQLDLSAGSVVGLAGALAVGSGSSLAVGIPIGIAAAMAVGVVNGLLVTRVGVNSFIATLGTMVAVRGLTLVVTHGVSIVGPDLELSIAFARPLFGGLTPRVLVFLVLAALVHGALTRTVAGRRLFVVGADPVAADAVGISSRGHVLGAFVASSTLAGIGGVLLSIELNTGSALFGEGSLLIGIAAAIIGGTALTGGRGTAIGTLLGVTSLAAVAAGLNLMGVQQAIQQMVIGLILVLAVVLNRDAWESVRQAVRWASPGATQELRGAEPRGRTQGDGP